MSSKIIYLNRFLCIYRQLEFINKDGIYDTIFHSRTLKYFNT